MKRLLYHIFILSALMANAQSVVIAESESTPDASAILDVQSSAQGALMPRLTSEERDDIVEPALGLIIFNTDRRCLEFYAGTEWASATLAGTIRAFAGNQTPEGWLVCDGTAVSRAAYTDLFAALGTLWGDGDGSTTFQLPDLRGRFLRGLDSGAGNDPDASSRTDADGVNTQGDVVGSYQEDAFQGHWHNILAGLSGGNYVSKSNGGTGSGSSFNAGRDPISDGTNGDPRISSETRPKNVYVNYIIKY